MSILMFKTASGEELTVDAERKLGKGGEGTVYEVLLPLKYRGYCVKEYSAAILQDYAKLAARQAKIEYMVQMQVVSPSPHIIICWPYQTLFRNGQFVGFMMLKAFELSKELEWFVSYNLRKIINKTPFSCFDGSNGYRALYNRIVVANNLARAIHMIHATEHYVLADTKPRNILITSTGNVSIVDLDSLQIVVGGVLKFKAPVASPNYKPPEGYDGRLNQESDIIPISWDRFSYAVMAYELIIGSHPYGVGSYRAPYDQGDDTMYKIRTGLFLHGNKSAYLRAEHDGSLAAIRERWEGLPEPLRQLFMQAFEKGQFIPEMRPTLQAWGQALSQSVTALKPTLNRPATVSALAQQYVPPVQREAYAPPPRQPALSKRAATPRTPGNPAAATANQYNLPPPPVTFTRKEHAAWALFMLVILCIPVLIVYWAFTHPRHSGTPISPAEQRAAQRAAFPPHPVATDQPTEPIATPDYSGVATAQQSSIPVGPVDQYVVGMPELRAGMYWHFKSPVHAGSAEMLYKIRVVSADTLEVEKSWPYRDRISSYPQIYDRSWNLRRDGNVDYAPALQSYNFPLKVGSQWTTTSLLSGGWGTSSDRKTATGEVMGWEDVVTPAGKFHALKIVVYINETKEGQQVKQSLETTWYAPEAKYAVRTAQSSWQPSTQRWLESSRLELADYQAGGS
jgi:serine/threonine protein kinase